MADSTISALPAVGLLDPNALVPLVQAGVTSQVKASQIASLLAQISGQPLVSHAAGTPNALTASFNPKVSALVDGASFLVRAASANTAAATIAFDAVAAKPIVKGANTPLQAGDIAGAGGWLELTYDSSLDKFVLGNPVFPAGTSFPSLQVAGDVQMASANGGPLAGFRNHLINGSFGVWQRGFSVTCPPGLVYCADRWIAATAGSSNVNAGFASFGSGALPYPNDATALIWTLPSGAAFSNLRQRIEGAATLHTQQVSLSFSSKIISGATSLQALLIQHFGTGGSPSADVTTVLTGNAVLTSAYAIYAFSGTLPSVLGKTFGTNGDDYLELQIQTSSNAAHQLGITACQLEGGPLTTVFEFRPRGTELALCQRYFQVLSAASGVCSTAGVAQLYPQFPVQMRATPSLSATAPMKITDSMADYVQSSFAATFNGDQSGGYMNLQNFAGLTQFRSCGLSPNGGRLLLNAEL